MTSFDLLSKDDLFREDYHYASKLILSLKAQFAKDGGDPVDFPEYLKETGVTVDGQFIVATDEFVAMARLKFMDYSQ